MNDRDNQLERDLSLIPLPIPSKALDERVSAALRSEQRRQAFSSVPPSRTSDSVHLYWRVLQTIGVCLLCLFSFAAGRAFEARSFLPDASSTPPNNKQDAIVINVDIEPTVLPGFQSLVFNTPPEETILGPIEGLNLQQVR